jgi:hypothetical protein
VRSLWGDTHELLVSEKDFLEMVEDPSSKGDIEHGNDDIEHGNDDDEDDNEDDNDHDSETSELPSLEDIFGRKRCREGDGTSVEQPTEVTRDDIGPHKISRELENRFTSQPKQESNRQGTQTINVRSSTVIQGARSRKRSQPSSEPAIFPDDGAIPKRPRRTTKETWKLREAREDLETMRT